MKFLLFYARFTIFLLFVALAGCGFKLRGSEAIPLQLHQLQLETDNVDNSFRSALITAMHIRHINLSPQAPYVLRITNTEIKQTLTSTSTDMQVRNYLVTYSLQYEMLKHNGESLFPPRTLILTRTYVANSTQLLNENYKFSDIQHSLRTDAINQLFERLSTLKIEQVGS